MTHVDTHAHLNLPHFKGTLEAVLDRAARAGVERIICVGTDVESSQRALELADEYPEMLRAAVGIHPTAAGRADPEDVSRLEEMLEHPRVVAVGETGLDYHHDESSPEQQKQMFRRHLELSAEHRMPTIVHSRKADEDTLDLLRGTEGPLTGVRHCFDGSLQTAEEFLDAGLHISFTALVTRGGHKKLKTAAQHVPEDRILVETDCPYMKPARVDAEVNEPSFICHTVEALASLRDVPPETLSETCTENARRLFDLA